MATSGVLSSSAHVCDVTGLARRRCLASAVGRQNGSSRCRGTPARAITASSGAHAALPYGKQHQQLLAGHAERHYGFTGLASYRFRTQDIPCRWLEACVREAVAHIDEAPFLQITHAPVPSAQPSFQRTVLPDSAPLTSQVWQDLAQHFSEQPDAETVLYVAPLQPSPAAASAGSSSRSLRRSHAPEVLTGITATPLLRGHIGECCDDGEHAAPAGPPASGSRSQILPFLQAAIGGGVAGVAAARQLRAELPVDAEWGLVLQSKWHAVLNGAYILRTSSSRDPDCQCTHFSVVRAQEGQGVHEQMMAAWLAA